MTDTRVVRCVSKISVYHGKRPIFVLFVKLLTGYGQLLLAEFKYGLVPKESFAELIGDQAKPRRYVCAQCIRHRRPIQD